MSGDLSREISEAYNTSRLKHCIGRTVIAVDTNRETTLERIEAARRLGKLGGHGKGKVD